MPVSNYMPDVVVEIAFDSGYLTPAASRTWTDVSTPVEGDAVIKIQRGRPDQFSTVQPSRLSVTLDNRDGRFTPENASGAYYPNVKKGRPIRVRVKPVGAGAYVDRFMGYIDEWPVDWPDGTASACTVTITATSRMARLGKGGELKSIIEEEILTDGPTLYFPLGEPSGSTTAGNIAPGRTDLLSTSQLGTGGTLAFGNATGPGTDSLSAPTFTPASTGNGIVLASTLVAPVATTETFIDVEMFLNTSVVALQGVFRLQSWTFGTNADIGAGAQIGLNISAAGQAQFFFTYASGATFTTVTSATVVADGLTHHVAGRIALSGGNATASIIVDGGSRSSGASSAYSPSSFPSLSVLFLGASGSVNSGTASMFSGSVAHLAISATSSATTDARIQAHANAGLNGFNTEASGARVARYARYAGIPTAEVTVETGLTSSVAHKDTSGETPVSLMQDVANTEDGVLFDGKDGTLTFHARSHRYGATSAFTLDVVAGDIETGLLPRLDDQNLTNDMTVSRPNGITARSTNAASISEYGYYRESEDILTTSDIEVQARADWQVNRFGTPRVTIPNVRTDLLSDSGAKITALLAADIGTRFTVTNLHAQAPSTTLDFFIEGVSEEIGPESYFIEFNTSAATYANVWIWDSASFAQWDQTTVFAY